MYGLSLNRCAVALIAACFCASAQYAGAQATSDDYDWVGIVSASMGHDDNLTLEDDTNAVASGLDDNYLEVLGFASRYVSGVRDNGVRINGTLFSRQYMSEGDYDFTLLGVGAGYDKPFSDWEGHFDAGYEHMTYGGETYQELIKLRAEGRRRLAKQTELRLRYEVEFIDAGDNYRYLDGTRQTVRAETRIKQGENRYRLSYAYEINDREDSRTATTFSSDSPERHILRAMAHFPLNSKWDGEIEARYRKSEYRDPDILSGGETITREDDRFRTRLGVEYKLADKTRVFGRYDYYNNDSNFTSKNYTRNLYSIGVNHFF